MKFCYFNYLENEGEKLIIDLPKEYIKTAKKKTIAGFFNMYKVTDVSESPLPKRVKYDICIEKAFDYAFPGQLKTERYGYYYMLINTDDTEQAKHVFMREVKAELAKKKAEIQVQLDNVNSLYTVASMIDSGEIKLDEMSSECDFER